MKHLSSYKLFEASSIRTDKSFESVVKDVLADLTDDGVIVDVDNGPPQYIALISSPTATPNKITIGPKGDLLDISSNLTQLVSFLSDDYSLSSVTFVWLDSSYKKHKFSEIISQKFKNGESDKFLSNCIKEFIGTRESDSYPNVFRSVLDVKLEFQRSNESIVNYKLSKDEFHKLHDDKDKTVVLDKYLNDAGRAGRRVYYILFKNSKIGALKMVYDLNSRSRQNFRVYDNFNSEIEFNKLEVYLMKNNMNYGVFNDAWYYIEDDFNNQGYH